MSSEHRPGRDHQLAKSQMGRHSAKGHLSLTSVSVATARPTIPNVIRRSCSAKPAQKAAICTGGISMLAGTTVMPNHSTLTEAPDSVTLLTRSTNACPAKSCAPSHVLSPPAHSQNVSTTHNLPLRYFLQKRAHFTISVCPADAWTPHCVSWRRAWGFVKVQGGRDRQLVSVQQRPPCVVSQSRVYPASVPARLRR